MADEHHEDHGNTLSAWFLTVTWVVTWSVAAFAIIFLGGDLVWWITAALGGSVAFAIVAGIMKKAGFGRKGPRPTPLTREEWEAARETADTGSNA